MIPSKLRNLPSNEDLGNCAVQSAPEKRALSKLIADPKEVQGSSIRCWEGEGLEEEDIDEPEAQSTGNEGDQDESVCVQRFMIKLSV